MRKQQLLPLTETAVLVALGVVLELIKKFLPIPFLQMPQGGSVWISILPIMIIGIRRGFAWGIAGGIAFGFLNFIIDGYAFHWGSIFFDYIFAFGVLGITGLFHKRAKNLLMFGLAFVLAGLANYIMHSISGVLFFGQYAEEAGYAGMVWFYSFIVYNLPYKGLSIIICTILGYILRPVVLEIKI